MIYEDENLFVKLAKKAAWEVGFTYGMFWFIDKLLPEGSKSQTEPIKLYKTGEKHSNGEDIYRPVGEKPKSGMYGLTGTYYVFDGYNMYACGKPYRDDYGTYDGEPSYPIYNYEIV